MQEGKNWLVVPGRNGAAPFCVASFREGHLTLVSKLVFAQTLASQRTCGLVLAVYEELLWEFGKGADMFFLDQQGSIELEQFGLGMLKWNQLTETPCYPRGCAL